MKSRSLAVVLAAIGAAALATPFVWSNKLKSDWNTWEAPPPTADSQSKLMKLAQVGDSFGPFNTLFASLAFVTALLAIWNQHKEAEKADGLRRADDEQRVIDKKAEDNRHARALAAQERIARVSALSTMVSTENLRLEKTLKDVIYLERLSYRLDGFAKSWSATNSNDLHISFMEVFNEAPGFVSNDESQRLRVILADALDKRRAARGERSKSRGGRTIELDSLTKDAFDKLGTEVSKIQDAARGMRSRILSILDDLNKQLTEQLQASLAASQSVPEVDSKCPP